MYLRFQRVRLHNRYLLVETEVVIIDVNELEDAFYQVGVLTKYKKQIFRFIGKFF